MTGARRVDLQTLVTLLDGDRDLLALLEEAGLVCGGEEGFPPEEAELARVARTLMRDLEVNWPGVEIILHMRAQMLEMQAQVAELVRLLRARMEDEG